MSVLLKGITWSHSRGYTSITAVSQRFCELNPGVSIEWEKRSLQEFADAPIENPVSYTHLGGFRASSAIASVFM